MAKILYFDVETTGTNPAVHEITQLAMIIEIDGVVVEEANFTCQPTRWDQIDPGAIATTGVTIEMLKTFQPPALMYDQVTKLLGRYIPKYTRLPDKFYPAGHNVEFDLKFLDAFLRMYGNADMKQWGAITYQNYRAIDSRALANFHFLNGHLQTLSDVKLATLCNHFGIKIDAHDALSDIRATRQLIAKFRDIFYQGNKV